MTTTINASTSSGLVNTADTSGILQLQTASTAALTIDASQNVGIGTASPSDKLQVTGGYARIDNTGSSALRLYNSTTQVAGIGLQGWSGLGSANDLSVGTVSSNNTIFMTALTERMRIDSSGNVGIGTSSPAYKLSVNGRISYSGVIGEGADTTLSSTGTALQLGLSSTWTENRFYTGGTERMRIDSSGRLLVGTTSTQNISGVSTDNTFLGQISTNRWVCGFINNSASSPYGLGINYTGSAPNNTGNQSIFFTDTGGTRFEVRSNGGIANYSANNVNLSDAREKTNVELAGNYLDKICAIPVKTFLYKDQTDSELNLGVIAQDVEVVAPELIDASGFGETPEDGIPLKAIYQTDLQYALMKCIQEQQALITDLTTRLAALEGAK
jgi:hypothetical protein